MRLAEAEQLEPVFISHEQKYDTRQTSTSTQIK